MVRRILTATVLAGLAVVAVGAHWQARRSDEAAQPGWSEYSGPPRRAVQTPLLSVRRIPEWLTAPTSKARLSNAFSTAMERPEAPGRTCLVVYLNDEPAFEHLGDELLVPASLLKIVTASAFLEEVGEDYRYTTRTVVRADALAEVGNGVLNGDVYLVGGGDPVLSTPDYVARYPEERAHTDITDLAESTAAALEELGISDIRGRVIADESRYPEAEQDYADMRIVEDADPIWKPSFVTHNQVGPLSALLLDDGYASYPSDPSPAGRRQNGRADDPALHAAATFDDLLEERGLRIRRSPDKGEAPENPDEQHVLASVDSPSADEIVARMLRHSDNTTAEMLFKEVGKQAGVGSARSSAVLATYNTILKKLDLPPESTGGMVISDGSGLSSYNRLSCRIVVELLRSAGIGSELVDGLAVAGESGTLRDCAIEAEPNDAGAAAGAGASGTASAESGEVLAKTGTLNDVSAIAGVTATGQDDVFTFAMIANGENIMALLGFCNVLQRSVVEAVLGYPYGPSATDPELLPEPAAVTEPVPQEAARHKPAGVGAAG